MGDEQIIGEIPDLKPEQIISPLSPWEELSEEEVQYWHSPYYDELQARKEALKEKEKTNP